MKIENVLCFHEPKTTSSLATQNMAGFAPKTWNGLESLCARRQNVENRKQLESVVESRENPVTDPTKAGYEAAEFLLSHIGPHVVSCDRRGAFSILKFGEDPVSGATLVVYSLAQDFSRSVIVWNLYDAKNNENAGDFNIANEVELSALKDSLDSF